MPRGPQNGGADLPPGYVNPMYLPGGLQPAGTHSGRGSDQNGRATRMSGPDTNFDPRNRTQTQVPEDLAGSLCPPFSQMVVSQAEEDQADFSFNQPLVPYGQMPQGNPQLDPRFVQNMPAYMQGNVQPNGMPNPFARGPQYPNPRFQQQRPFPQDMRRPQMPGQGQITVADLIRAASTGSSITGDPARDDKILSDILGAKSSGTKRLAMNAMTASGLSRPALESLGLVESEEELQQIQKDDGTSDRKEKKDDSEEIGMFRRVKKRAPQAGAQAPRQNDPLFPEPDFITQARRGQQPAERPKNPQFRTAALLAALTVASGNSEYSACMYFIAKHVAESAATGPDSNAFKAYAEAVFKHVGDVQATDGNRRFDEKYQIIKDNFTARKEEIKEFVELSKMSKDTRDLKIKTINETVVLTHGTVKARVQPIRKYCAAFASLDKLPKREGFADLVEATMEGCLENLQAKIRNLETQIELTESRVAKTASAHNNNLSSIAKYNAQKAEYQGVIDNYLRDNAPAGTKSNYATIKELAASIDSSFEQISLAKKGVGLDEKQWRRYQEVRKDLANTGDAYVFWTLYKAGI